MREIIIFIASLAGAAILSALAILIRPESVFWKVLLWGGIAVFVACACVLLFDYFRPGSRPFLLVGAGTGIALFLGFGIAIIFAPQGDAPKKSDLSPKVFDAQFAELQKLMTFMSGKDETGLRQLFDFDYMLERNIAILVDRVNLLRAGKISEFNLGPYLEKGQNQMLATVRVGRWTMTAGGPKIEAGPHEVYVIMLPQKYQESKELLTQFENSTLLPTAVLQPLHSFAETVNDDAELLIITLNEKLQESEEQILQEHNYGSKYYGVIRADYYRQFKVLKPKADAVADAIRLYLGTT